MTAFEDKVNAELPRRPALMKVAAVGYDGDPNLPAAPDDLDNAPGGTLYLQETPEILWRKTADGVRWTLNEDVDSTTSTITVTIDPASTVPQPPAATIFRSQAEVDDYLEANGGTAFKHLRDFMDRLPQLITRDVTVNLVAGVHRPRTTHPILAMNRVRVGEADIRIMGVPVASWDTLHAGGTIRAHQTLSEVTGVADPYVDCDPSTFPNDNSLAGSMAVLSNGFYSIIWKHTDSRLWLCKKLAPVPVDDSTTVAVKRPATILRNSLDDVNPAYSASYMIDLDFGDVSRQDTWTWFFDLLVQDFGNWVPFALTNSMYAIYRTILDKTFGPAGQTGDGYRFWGNAYGYVRDSSCIAGMAPGTTSDGTLTISDRSFCHSRYSYFQGGAYYGPYVNGRSDLWFWNSVVRGAGGYPDYAGALNATESYLDCYAGGFGVVPTIGDTVAPYSAIRFEACHTWLRDIRFMDLGGSGIEFGPRSSLDIRASWYGGGLDHSANVADAIFYLRGPQGLAAVGTHVTVEGDNGAVKFDDGTFLTWAEIAALGGVMEDERGNMIVYADSEAG